MTSRYRNLMFPAALLAIGAALFAHTFSTRYSGMGIGDAYGPLFYPRLLLLAWIGLAVIALIQGAVARTGEESLVYRWRIGGAMMLACGLFVALILTAGFLIASCLFFAASALILGYRNYLVIAVTGVLTPTAIWYLFHVLIEIRLPTSPWAY